MYTQGVICFACLTIYILRYIRSERLEKMSEEFNLNHYRSVSNAISKGLRKSNFTELAPKFRLDLVAPIEQNHRNSPAEAAFF